MSKPIAVAVSALLLIASTSRAQATSYTYDFHFDAYSSFSAADVYYTGDTVGASTVTYLRGSVNGLKFGELFYNGYSYNSGASRFGPSGQLVDYLFEPDTAPMLGANYTAYGARRGISSSSSATAYVPTAGVLTISEDSATTPEAATWAMLISGFGLIGFVLRKRRCSAELSLKGLMRTLLA